MSEINKTAVTTVAGIVPKSKPPFSSGLVNKSPKVTPNDRVKMKKNP